MYTVLMRYPEGKAKAVTFSYDDGVVQDKRLAAIFDTYGMKATFNFVNNVLSRFTKEQIKEIFLDKGHEVAVHCAHHRANGNTRAIEGIREVLDSRLFLEDVCDRIIRGMAYPDTGIRLMGSFITYEQIKAYLTELDIAYARTLGGDNDKFRLPEDFHAWMPTAHHNNPQLLEYVDKFLELDISTNVYHARRQARLLYIWGHSYEFDRDNNWELIETVCEKLAHNDEIWYATNLEICDYVTAYRRLQYSANGQRVYNPTCTDVWMDVDGAVYQVGS